jgi:hypothetical protein
VRDHITPETPAADPVVNPMFPARNRIAAAFRVFIIFPSFWPVISLCPTRLKSGSEIPRGKMFFSFYRGGNFLVRKPVIYVNN